jgi:hypothetical protein
LNKKFGEVPLDPDGIYVTPELLDKLVTISTAASSLFNSKNALIKYFIYLIPLPYLLIAMLNILADSDSASALIIVSFFSSSDFMTINLALNYNF